MAELKNLRSEAGTLCVHCSSSQQCDPCRTSSSIAMSSMTLSLTYPSFVRTNRASIGRRNWQGLCQPLLLHLPACYPCQPANALQRLIIADVGGKSVTAVHGHDEHHDSSRGARGSLRSPELTLHYCSVSSKVIVLLMLTWLILWLPACRLRMAQA